MAELWVEQEKGQGEERRKRERTKRVEEAYWQAMEEEERETGEAAAHGGAKGRVAEVANFKPDELQSSNLIKAKEETRSETAKERKIEDVMCIYRHTYWPCCVKEEVSLLKTCGTLVRNMSMDSHLPKQKCKKTAEDLFMAKWCENCAKTFQGKIERCFAEQEKYGVGWGLWEIERMRRAKLYWLAMEREEKDSKKKEEEKLRKKEYERGREERERERRDKQKAEKQRVDAEKLDKAKTEKERRGRGEEEEGNGRKRGKSFLRFLQR
ncbi:hypothetical protein MMC30_004400 [Trapelia coarctata]|nr:hypothetical protein [Trapelia coarctata]